MTMVKREDVILNATENMVHHKLKNDPSGHDWFHIVRVRNLAVELAHKEGANTFICQMAALLHDIIDDKICQDSKQASYELTQWLYSQDLAIAEVEHILDILENISFKAGTGLTMKTLEGQIVQDADRLDAMGAIGIARTMAYSGSKGRLIHDPNLKPRENLTLEEYRNGQDTQNEMTVNHLWQNGKSYQVTGLGYAPEGQILFEGDNICFGNSDRGDLEKLIRFAHLCSNAQVLPPNDDRSTYTVLGDPTEACLNVLLEKSGINIQENRKFAPRLKELPFDSVRKRMTTIHSLGGDEKDKKISITKGAPKEILDLSDYVLSDGKVIPLNKEERNKIQLANDTFAKDGLRVLAVSYCDIEGFSKEQWTQENLEQHMVFIGLIAMSDPPREGVREAIDKCHAASIRIIMVTGDYGLTALSIAKNIGIIRNDDAKVISGLELSEMTDSQLKKELSGEVVFARVAPEQKYRVVTILQEMGEVVAVTGDGVNDAPALKKSDIGVAMGVTGTDVAKESADMILTDDHFASIVHAVEEGRAVYQNIKKFLTYIFNSNTPEAVPSAFFLFSKGFIPLPLTVMQILAVDLGTDMLPALGLGVEPPETDVMNRPPRRLTDRLLDKGLLIKSFLWYGTIESVLAMGGFFWAHYLRYGNFTFFVANGIPYREATTMTLGAIIFSQIGMVMNSRTSYQSIKALSIFGNKLINFGIIMEILAFLVLVYVPLFHNLFNTASLGLSHWLYLISCPFIMIGLDEVRKLFSSRKNKR